jgi:hypothetical protein
MRALREAGPPIRWIVAAIPLALAAVIVLYVAGVNNEAVLLAIPFVAFVLVGLIDRDGWRIRMAMAEVAARQREHWRTGRLPIDPPSADAWLIEHPDARAVARAAVLATAGRHEEARSLVESIDRDTPLDALNLARLRILFAAEARGDHSIAAVVDRPRGGARDGECACRGRAVSSGLRWHGRWRGCAFAQVKPCARRLRRRDPTARALPGSTSPPGIPCRPALRVGVSHTRPRS